MTLRLDRPKPNIVVLHPEGVEADASFAALEGDLEKGPIEVFIDARGASKTSLTEVWDDERVSSVTLLTIDEVAPTSSKMRVFSDPAAFDEALARAKRGSYF